MDLPPITPLLAYRDPRAALAFVEAAFGSRRGWWSMTGRVG
jgi:uncharacterized glyoxalase superfamily protein PhnB